MTYTEINAEIAEKVMGLRVEMQEDKYFPHYFGPKKKVMTQLRIGGGEPQDFSWDIPHPYSTSISHAFLVVEKMREEGFMMKFHTSEDRPDRAGVCFEGPTGQHQMKWYEPQAKSICLAALKALDKN